MPSIGRWQVTQWDSGLTVGVQTKVMTLLQNTEKKEDWSFKRYEMIKWIFCYATLIIEILLIACCIHWSVHDFIEIPNDTQTTLNWYTYFLKLILTEEPNYYLTLERNAYEKFPVYVSCL